MRIELSWAIDRVFHASVGRLPYFQRYAPDITLLGDSDKLVARAIGDHLASRPHEAGAARFLDIGARDGVRATFARSCEYSGLDIAPQGKGIIAGDICSCPQIPDESFDITFSYDVFEHLKRPWDAADECLRITRPGGLVICRTLFAYRYHPEPVDYWRFTAQGLEYLFTERGRASTLVSGYDTRGRRRNRTGVYLDHRPPIDWMGGFRENWQVLWIGRKL